MLMGGILHPGLLKLMGECGHTDWLMLSDAGMPIPCLLYTSRCV